MSDPLVRINDLVARRDGAVVLEVPDLKVLRGEVLAVMGPNGAGKTTLLHVLALLHPTSEGRVWFAGDAVLPSTDLVRLRRRMALVFQEPLLLDTSVRDNVATGLRIRGVGRRVAAERAGHWMKRFGVADLADRSARRLSGGEAQRVSLARAFALDPELLLLDEPFAALDPPTRIALVDDFEQVLRDTRVTTVFVTHDRTEAIRMGDRIAVVMGGRIAQVGTPEGVFSTPANEEVAAFVGVENLIAGRVEEQSEGLARVSLGTASAEAVSDVVAGQPVMACLRPEDVVVAPVFADSPVSSARNRLRGRIARLTPLGSQVRISMDCGFPLVALVTRRSAQDLSFSEGMEVAASFKASSVHLIPR